ncbi:hypothetical protein AB0J55_00545 [Amycolatopsis sp. NPDC049688]|uniref:hypothetical protein n=1 Tax=Amycolatopsis sp. NPDC049688 TaxID=3154733 RepID=UPI0034132734
MTLQVLERVAAPNTTPIPPARRRGDRKPVRRVRLAAATSIVLAVAAAPLSADAATTVAKPDRMSCSNPDTRWATRYPWDWVGEVFVRFSVPGAAMAKPAPVKVTIAWGAYRSYVKEIAFPGEAGGTKLVFAKLDGTEAPLYDTVFKADRPVCVQFGIGPEMLYTVSARTVALRDWVPGHDIV